MAALRALENTMRGIYSRSVSMTRDKVAESEREGGLRGTLNSIEKNQEKEYGNREVIWSGDRHTAY